MQELPSDHDYLKVENEPGLVRDANNSLLATDQSALAKRRATKRRERDIDFLISEKHNNAILIQQLTHKVELLELRLIEVERKSCL